MALTDPLIGRQLGDYRIDDILGRGGMAHVYRGYDPKLQRYAAVKVIDANLLKESETEYRERFQREARAVARLNHPNIVGVYQFGEIGSLYYMAMVFIEGRDLGQILKDHAADHTLMSMQEILRIVHDIAGALDYAHAGGVIHRDIKPSNIMVTTDNRAVLTDFGLALSVPEGSLGNTFGSAHYIAPEQAISSANAVAQSDLYSLGVVLYQMLTGRIPFDDPSAMGVALKHLSDPPPPLRQFNAQLPPAAERVVLKALEKEPSKRYQNGESMARALEEALDVSTIDQRYLPSIESSRPSRLFPPTKRDTSEVGTSPTLQFADDQVAQSRLRATQAMRRLSTDGGQRRLLIGGVVVVLIVVVGIGAILSQNQGAGAVTPTAAVVAATDPEVDTLVPVAATTDEPSAEPSATDSPTEPIAVETTAAPTLTNTSEPTEAPTEIPAVVETVVGSAAGAGISLIYDGDKLVLINRSDRPVDIRGWSFVQHAAFADIAFLSTQWQTPILSAVPPNNCFMIWRNSLNGMDTPDYCDRREAWFAAGTNRRFWLSAQADATFEVRDGSGALLATCPVNEGECLINLEEE